MNETKTPTCSVCNLPLGKIVETLQHIGMSAQDMSDYLNPNLDWFRRLLLDVGLELAIVQRGLRRTPRISQVIELNKQLRARMQ